MKNKKILLTEDDANNRYLLKLFLIKKGFEVHTAESVADALELISENKYDLYITDIMLKGELTSDVLVSAGLESTLVLTAFEFKPEDFDHVTYIRKPFKLDFLLETINNLIDKPNT